MDAAHPKLTEQREIWARKPALRAVYADYYSRIVAWCGAGRTLEIGGGSGNLKALWPEAIATDLVPAPWLDVAADAEALPFRDASVTNIVGVDVLHHLPRPRRFFGEAERVLAPGGRIVLLEPAVTAGSYLFYRFLHPEPVVLGVDPLADAPAGPRDPFDSNQAIPSLMFGRRRREFERAFPSLSVVERRYLSLIAYPLSGGFRRWSLVPAWLAGPLLAGERLVERPIGPLLGFRLLVVLEKRAAAG
jgi:SAM-dependent methyltransferase